MRKFFESKNWLLEISNDNIAFDFILHRKDIQWIWFRIGKKKFNKYFFIEIFRLIISADFGKKY